MNRSESWSGTQRSSQLARPLWSESRCGGTTSAIGAGRLSLRRLSRRGLRRMRELSTAERDEMILQYQAAHENLERLLAEPDSHGRCEEIFAEKRLLRLCAEHLGLVASGDT